jgi:phospholipase C
MRSEPTLAAATTVCRSVVCATLVLMLAMSAALAQTGGKPSARDLARIEHIVVIYLENHSFDNLFGNFPGANGLSHAGRAAVQLDRDGKPYQTLPPIDERFAAHLPNRPFLIDRYVPLDGKFPSPVHLFYDEQQQIDHGSMEKFVAYSTVGGLVMGYQDGSKLALWKYARDFTLADNFFHATFGGSFLNHFWTICACTPRFEQAPETLRAKLDDAGKLIKNGAVTPDGYAVNTLQSVYRPHDEAAPAEQRLPPQTARTIGDALSDKNVSWAWYSGGWNDALAGKADANFQYHHQPFAYFEKYGEGTKARSEHLKDERDLVAALDAGSLPAVVFWKPIGELNEHPGYADTLSGDRHMREMIERIRTSPLWRGTVVVVTYDENGGFWDHVAPPHLDRWGPGSRVPTVIISPFAKRHHIDHTYYDTTSILKLIELRFGLAALGERDRGANALLGTLDFQR